ncbi:MAG: aminotransferase class IV, partial [Anaerovibrio sp.]|nr:aminotransferase class IV [Anaerovibrio sp.]
KEELGKLLTDLLKQVEGETHFVYWQVTRGVAPRDHAYSKDMIGKLWVWIKQSKAGDPKKELKLIVRPDTRFQHGNAKTLNLLPAVAGTQLAVSQGADECVLHRDGLVTECCHSNIQILKDGMLITHPDDQFILRGIAKTHMTEACRRLGITVMERAFTLEEMYEADEVIVTASSKMCQHAAEIEGRKVGGKDPETLHRIEQAVIQEYLDYTGKAALLD